MRYWHPFSDAAARAVHAWRPDDVVLLPLYPQYSTTTTGSSLTAWREAAARVGLVARTSDAVLLPDRSRRSPAATAALAREAYQRARAELPEGTALRVLFSAHGLPEVIVRRAIPYQWQVEQTVAAVLAAWEDAPSDWAICYQSRATPQQWIGPSTDAEVERAGRDKVAVLVVPIAFVSEHSETLVELDVEYRHLAERVGVPGYFRVPTQNADAGFIDVAGRAGAAARWRTGPGCAAMKAAGSARREHRGLSVHPAPGGVAGVIDSVLVAAYPWTKALHVISMVAWMAGMFYLPRLYVYHCEVAPGTTDSERFKVMERRLLKQIINPAMIATWTFGSLLIAHAGGDRLGVDTGGR